MSTAAPASSTGLEGLLPTVQSSSIALSGRMGRRERMAWSGPRYTFTVRPAGTAQCVTRTMSISWGKAGN
ncbi:C2H2 zinc finger protein [Ectocarpus siliculosus]|uniref:C2H2 zinc finger protein n=1 Tax=Ectocarpus siliculosus TaxID=2880 RepID=D8LU81_ECTSI|nr:C2H2 zinc finger protein [Ectocarpus siliculosus]|eukprot:CBN75422.1 C2H2 zinc finger protein [Ectocarpus siliculosus]